MSAAVALLFPGQGAQTVGMGRVAYETSAAARDVFAQADDALAYPLSRLILDGPEEGLRRTERQQPAILTTSLALLAAHQEREGPFPVACGTGHSLGLYTALVAAGALTLHEGVRLVALRGELMQRAGEQCPGGMAAVLGLDDATVEDVCDTVSREGDAGDVVVAANYNAPGQVVISGLRPALERATEELKGRGARKVVPLSVSGAFHSPAMRPAAAALAPALHEAAIQAPAYPIVGNATARELRSADEIRGELVGQILAPVRWSDAVRSISAGGVREFVDCGPGTTLASLLKRIVPDAPVIRLDGGSA